MRQNNISKKIIIIINKVTCSAVVYSPACGWWRLTIGEYLSPDIFKTRFQGVFEPFLRGNKSALAMGIHVQPSLAFKLFARENVTFYTKQDFIFHIDTTSDGRSSSTKNWKRNLDYSKSRQMRWYTYIQNISDETGLTFTSSQNWSAAKPDGFATMKLVFAV